MGYGQDQLKLHRVSSRYIAENVGSVHVFQKLGMRQEGRLHDNDYFKGRRWDTAMFAILDREWIARQAD